MRFYPEPYLPPTPAFAALVFAWSENQILVGDIVGRGWCIPSGRLEPGETSQQAARRESLEECGAVLGELYYFGCFQLPHSDGDRWAECFATTIAEWIEIGVPSESKGRRLVKIDELPEMYYLWNDLVKSVFQLSKATLAARVA
jgi:8-oxo-dGTP diphosphatase